MADVSKIFKPRRGKLSTMLGTKASTVLAAGEMFFEVPDTGVGTGRGRIMMGDGSTTYVNLAGANNNSGANSQAAKYFMPFTQDEIIIHPGDDTKTVSASSSISSAAVATNLNNAKSGAALKTIIHNLREAIYSNACDIAKLNNEKSYVGMIIHSYTLDTEAKVKEQYGGTAWSQITSRFLYGSNSAGTIGGSNDAIVVSHTHSISGGSTNTNNAGIHNHALQVNQFFHPLEGGTNNSWAVMGEGLSNGTDAKGDHSHTVPDHNHNCSVTGSNGTNANMPAYMTCFIWRRTA